MCAGFGLRASGHGLGRSPSPWPVAHGPWLIALFFSLTSGHLQAQRSPFNKLKVLPADSTGHYRILIGGHFHGESTNRSGYPAATLLANLDTINTLGANLFLSTGDLFMDPVNDMPRYQRSLFSKLKMPLFNAAGNHDYTNAEDGRSIVHVGEDILVGGGNVRTAWSQSLIDSLDREEERIRGVPHFDGPYARLRSILDEFVVLNTEANGGSIDAKGVEILGLVGSGISALAEQGEFQGDMRLFIISHRPIWSEDDPQYSPLFKDNTRSLTGTNFQKDVYPLLEKIAEHAHVYWISGSLGGSAPSSIFFQEHAKNITYIQCAIRDEPRDALLIADVYPDTVKWSSFSLTGQKLLAPEQYNAAWWHEHIGKSEGFNWRLLPYLVKTTVLRKEFWWGALAGAVLLVIARRLYRRSS